MSAGSAFRVVVMGGLIALAACDIPTRPTEVSDSNLGPAPSRLWVGQLLEMAVLVDKGMISGDEFLRQLGDLLTTIDSTPGGVESLRRYLETRVGGRSIPAASRTIESAPSIGLLAARDQSLWDGIKNSTAYKHRDRSSGDSGGVQSLRQYLETSVAGRSVRAAWSTFEAVLSVKLLAAGNQSLWDRIKNSIAYKQLEAFLTTVIFQVGVPEPASSLIQATDPQMFITLSQAQVTTHILDAQFSNRINVLQANELLSINATNPYDAERQLLTAQGLPIPAWLQPAPRTCALNCVSKSGNYRGTFDNQDDQGTFSRTFPQTTCTWRIRSAGTAILNLTVNSDNTLSGSVRVTGTSTATTISGSTANFTCNPDRFPFDDPQSVFGSVYRMTWTTDLGGGNTFRGAFTGDLQRSQVIGNIAVSYSLGRGSATLGLTLSKQ